MILGPCIDIILGAQMIGNVAKRPNTGGSEARSPRQKCKAARWALNSFIILFVSHFPSSKSQTSSVAFYLYIRCRLVLSSHHSWSTCGFCHVTKLPSPPEYLSAHINSPWNSKGLVAPSGTPSHEMYELFSKWDLPCVVTSYDMQSNRQQFNLFIQMHLVNVSYRKSCEIRVRSFLCNVDRPRLHIHFF